MPPSRRVPCINGDKPVLPIPSDECYSFWVELLIREHLRDDSIEFTDREQRNTIVSGTMLDHGSREFAIHSGSSLNTVLIADFVIFVPLVIIAAVCGWVDPFLLLSTTTRKVTRQGIHENDPGTMS